MENGFSIDQRQNIYFRVSISYLLSPYLYYLVSGKVFGFTTILACHGNVPLVFHVRSWSAQIQRGGEVAGFGRGSAEFIGHLAIFFSINLRFQVAGVSRTHRVKPGNVSGCWRRDRTMVEGVRAVLSPECAWRVRGDGDCFDTDKIERL